MREEIIEEIKKREYEYISGVKMRQIKKVRGEVRTSERREI